MKAGIIVSERGFERIVSVGTGPEAATECRKLLELIWPDIEAFDGAIRARRLAAEPKSKRRQPVLSVT